MKDKIFSVLQRVGRSFMLPIAILPVAGLLLGIGSSFTNATTIETYGLTKILGDGTLLHSLLVIMNSVGSAVFNNLPLIFAVGVAIGMAQKEKEVAALSSVIAFFVMNTAINAMLTITGQILDNGEIAERCSGRNDYFCLRYSVLTDGCVWRYYRRSGSCSPASTRFLRRIQLPNALSFFGGTRFVPIISTIVYMFVGILALLCMAGRSDRNLRSGRSGNRLRLCGNTDFRTDQTCTDSVRSAPRILYAILADSRWRYNGSSRTDGSGRSEYFLCAAC